MRKTILTALLLASATAGAQSFPASGWVSLKQGGVDIVDPRQDIALGQPERDVIGDAANPAAYVYSDGTYAYFRLRVDGDPETGGGVFMGFGWACQLSTDGDPTGYEIMVLLNGKDPAAVEVWREDPPKTNDPGDTADTFVGQYEAPRFDDLTQAVPAGSAIGGAGDHFVDWAIPIADLPGVTLTTSIQLVCGTNSNGNPVLTTGGSADVMNEAPARMTWSTIASDPITFGCGTFGCPGALTCAPSGQCVECEVSGDCPDAEPICVGGMCEPCDADSECVSRDPGTPACLEAPGPGTCVECEDDTDCASPTPVCNLATHVCEPECATSQECPESTPICSSGSCVGCTLDAQCENRDPANPACNGGGECVPCTASNEDLCTTQGQVCDAPNEICVECNVDAQCGPTEPICNEGHVCVPECETSAQCTADPGRPICHTGACVPCSLDMECEDKDADTPACVMTSGDSHFGHCVECSATADGICTSAQPPQVCDVPEHVCAGCVEDSDCQGAGDPPETPECGDAQQCVACSSDDVCGARDPEEPACQPEGTTHAGACGECSETNDDRCTGAKPVCDTDEGACVACLVNTDCTSAAAPFCDIATHTCVAGCDEDGDCPEPRPVCNVAGPLSGLCTECSVEKTQRCQGTDEPICNPADGTCVECLVTPDCPTGVCLAQQCVECVTNADCPTAKPFCNTGTHTCQEDCPNDAACPGQTPVCNFTGPLTGQCSECAPRDSHRCTNDEPVCDPTSGTCVECSIDAQCPGGTCVDHICVVNPPPGPDAGVPLPPDAAVATPDAAEPPPAPDAAVVVVFDAPPAPAPDAAAPAPDAAAATPDAAAPAIDARLADAAGSTGARPDGRVEDPITPAGGLVAGGGCDCRAAGGSSSGSAAWSLLVVGLFVIVRRRRGAGR